MNQSDLPEERRISPRSSKFFNLLKRAETFSEFTLSCFLSVTSPLAERKGERERGTLICFSNDRFSSSSISHIDSFLSSTHAVFATIQSLALSCVKCPKKKRISASSKGENSIERIRAMNEQMCTTNNGSPLKSIRSFILRERKTDRERERI